MLGLGCAELDVDTGGFELQFALQQCAKRCGKGWNLRVSQADAFALKIGSWGICCSEGHALS